MCNSHGECCQRCIECENHKTNSNPDGCPGSMGECARGELVKVTYICPYCKKDYTIDYEEVFVCECGEGPLLDLTEWEVSKGSVKESKLELTKEEAAVLLCELNDLRLAVDEAEEDFDCGQCPSDASRCDKVLDGAEAKLKAYIGR